MTFDPLTFAGILADFSYHRDDAMDQSLNPLDPTLN